jgi:putative glutamine amidotransferase
MNIGLTQRVEALPDRHERRDCLDQAWSKLLLDAGFTPVILPNQPAHTETLVRALNLQGVILTGGNDLAGLPGATNVARERDEFEGNLLTVCTAKRLPVLGVCRGMQMIVRHYGGELKRVENHVCHPHPIVPRGVSMPTLPRAEVNSFHGFGVEADALPANLIVAGLAPDGTVEAVVHRELPQWGIMWHPERPTRADGDQDDRDIALMRALFGGSIE